MRHKVMLSIAIALATAIGSSGCGGSDSSDGKKSDSGGDAAQVSGVEREARDAAMAEVQKHWVKATDGWITARVSGSAYAPDHYLREIREITVVGVNSNALAESDKLNGFEWAGVITFKQAPVREAGDSGPVLEGMANINVERPKGKWSQWVDYAPEELHVQKVKGKWQVNPQDTWLLHGNLPTPEDYAKAGVK